MRLLKNICYSEFHARGQSSDNSVEVCLKVVHGFETPSNNQYSSVTSLTYIYTYIYIYSIYIYIYIYIYI